MLPIISPEDHLIQNLNYKILNKFYNSLSFVKSFQENFSSNARSDISIIYNLFVFFKEYAA